MSILIRPAKTSDIKKIREIVSHYISERRLLAKETVTLYESVQEFSVAEVNGEYRDWETDRKSTRLNSSHRL